MLSNIVKLTAMVYAGYFILNCYTEDKINKYIMEKYETYQALIPSLFQEVVLKIKAKTKTLDQLVNGCPQDGNEKIDTKICPKGWKCVKRNEPEEPSSSCATPLSTHTQEDMSYSVSSSFQQANTKFWNRLFYLCETIFLNPLFSFICGLLGGLLLPKLFVRRGQHEEANRQEHIEEMVNSIVGRANSAIAERMENLDRRTVMWMNSIEAKIVSLEERSSAAGTLDETVPLLEGLLESRRKQEEEILNNKLESSKMLEELKSEIDSIKKEIVMQKRDIAAKIEEMTEQNEQADIRVQNTLKRLTGEDTDNTSASLEVFSKKVDDYQSLIEDLRKECNDQYLELSSDVSRSNEQMKECIEILNDKYFTLERKMLDGFELFASKLAKLDKQASSLNKILANRSGTARTKPTSKKVCVFPDVKDIDAWLHSSCPHKCDSKSHHPLKEERRRRLCSIISRSSLAREAAKNFPDMIR